MNQYDKDIFFEFDTFPRDTRVYLFGAGMFGRNLLKEFRAKRPDVSVLGFVDSMLTGEIDGLPVVSLNVVAGYDYIVPATPCWHGMGVALARAGVENIALVKGENVMVHSVVRNPDNTLMYTICSRTGSTSLVSAVGGKSPKISGVVQTKSPDDPYSFSVVRNPFNRVVSCYHGHFRAHRTPFSENVFELMGKDEISFKEFVEWVAFEPNWAKDNHLRPYSMLVPEWIDHVGRLEDIPSTIETIRRDTGIVLDVHRRFASKRKHVDYRPYYDDYLKGLVEDVYAEDLEQFGYQF